MKYIENHGGREKYHPTKLKKDRAGDCVVRAIAIATERDWVEVRDELFDLAKEIGFMPNDTTCYRLYLKRIGWVKHSPMKKGKRKYKVKNMAKFFKDENVVIHTSHHLTALVKGNLNDTWNCGDWCANTYWTKK